MDRRGNPWPDVMMRPQTFTVLSLPWLKCPVCSLASPAVRSGILKYPEKMEYGLQVPTGGRLQRRE